jgi:hypothetical protein
VDRRQLLEIILEGGGGLDRQSRVFRVSG